MSTGTTVVTRFAPSPTGYLHVGGARTALFNWLLARHLGGRFLLRIEDTDLRRSTEEATAGLIEDLRWLGLHWDNPQIVYQSKRLDVYNRIIDDMIARGMAYKAYETMEELDVHRKQAEREKRAYIYRRPKLAAEQVAAFEAEGRPSVVRFAMPVKEYRFDDVVLGKPITLPPSQVQDIRHPQNRRNADVPLRRGGRRCGDGSHARPARAGASAQHAQSHRPSGGAGLPAPIYGHLPIIMNVDGSKMSKRDRDKKIRHRANLWMKKAKSEAAAAELAQAAGLSGERVSDVARG